MKVTALLVLISFIATISAIPAPVPVSAPFPKDLKPEASENVDTLPKEGEKDLEGSESAYHGFYGYPSYYPNYPSYYYSSVYHASPYYSYAYRPYWW